MFAGIKSFLIKAIIIYLIFCSFGALIMYKLDLYGLSENIAGFAVYVIIGIILGIISTKDNDSRLLIKSFFYSSIFAVILSVVLLLVSLVTKNQIEGIHYLRVLSMISGALSGTVLHTIWR
ncbi:MAG: hypothetical protein PUB67_05825 [Clostridiales bacterium]|nr:hypothetical protein [Clostridiales bacterium]